MSGVGWSCFAQLPAGLIDPRSASLTLNWLKPKPTHSGFKLKRDEVDAERHSRNLRIRSLALYAGVVLTACIAVLVAADRSLALGLLADERVLFVAIWSGTSGVAVAMLIYLLSAYAVMRYHQAEPRREAYLSACVEFEQIDAWRAARCDLRFWDALDDGGFEFEAAELLAGFFKTGQVMLTRAADDYGVDVLLCAPRERVVARCLRSKERPVGAPLVRELAGAKAFFGADRALVVSLSGLGHDHEQALAYAASLQLEIWDVNALSAVANHVRQTM